MSGYKLKIEYVQSLVVKVKSESVVDGLRVSLAQ